MTDFARRWLAASVAAALLAIGTRLSGQASATSLDALLTQYRAGDFAGVETRLLRASNDDLVSWQAQSSSFAGKHSNDLPAAAFLLEVAQAGYVHGMPSKAPFFEAGCKIARTGPTASPFDTAWQAAALSLVEGENAGDDYGSAPPYTGAVRSSAFLTHLPHAESRHVDPGTIALARAILQEQFARNAILVLRSYYGAAPPSAPGPGGRDMLASVRNENLALVARASHEAIDLFQKATAFESVRPEAVIRSAAMRSFLSESGSALGAGWDDAILTDLAQVEAATPDSRLVFLARVFRARYLEARNRLPESAKAYSDALKLFPNASSARTGLASVSFLAGEPVAPELIDGPPGPGPSIEADPWQSYRYGDYRLWNERLQALHSAMKGMVRP
jgi:hypothetical protein